MFHARVAYHRAQQRPDDACLFLTSANGRISPWNIRQPHPFGRLMRRSGVRDAPPMQVALQFSLAGIVADLDHTVTGDPEHPTLVLIIKTDDIGLVRFIVPATAWSRPRELLQVGRPVRVTESAFSLPPIAGQIELIEALH